jgi:anti-anti-sigma regulatory factor
MSRAGDAAVTTRTIGFRWVLAPRDALGDAEGTALMEAFWTAVEGGGREVWIDLSATTAIDADGAHAIERLVAAAHELDRPLVLVCPDPRLRRSLADAGARDLHATRSAAHYAR